MGRTPENGRVREGDPFLFNSQTDLGGRLGLGVSTDRAKRPELRAVSGLD